MKKQPSSYEPMFNLPFVIKALALVMIVIQLLKFYVLSSQQWMQVLALFSFIPVRYHSVLPIDLPGGIAANVWTFVSYTFLHGSWTHLLFNLLWMVVFATVVVRRIGVKNFALFYVITAAAGALVHMFFSWGSPVPLIGVSAVLSGAMAASARFIFSSPAGLSGFNPFQSSYVRPCLSMKELMRHQQAVMFLAIYIGLNLVFGLTSFIGNGDIAWIAHLGGFFAGLLVFPYLDPFTNPPRKPKPPEKPKKKPDHLRVIK